MTSEEKETFGLFHGDESLHDEDVVLTGSLPTLSATKSATNELNTLDEPVRETIWRDLKAVGLKFRHVLYPPAKNEQSLLKEWDLWGPLLLCTFMASILRDQNGQIGGPEFAEVFVVVWMGSAVVTLNTKLLGGRISFFQSVCVLGYCLLPLSLALIACRVAATVGPLSGGLFAVRATVSLLGLLWSLYASMKFLGHNHPKGRRGLVLYPVFLFYFVIAWLVISN